MVEVDALEGYVSPKVVELSLFPDFIYRKRWIWLQDCTGTCPGQYAIEDMIMLKAHRLFQVSTCVV
jgi:hypothetical protein